MTQPGGEFEAMGVVSYREPHFWAFSDSETIGTLHVQVREVRHTHRCTHSLQRTAFAQGCERSLLGTEGIVTRSGMRRKQREACS